MSENYTPRQLEILRFIVDFRRSHGYAPTLEEIGNALGVHRVTIHQHIGALEKRGAVERGAEYRRNIKVIDSDITGTDPEHAAKFELLKQHEGHEPIVVQRYEVNTDGDAGEYRVECKQCNVVIYTLKREEPE